mmetsp:Transcript_31346/g.73102  ORF Transcript_31346/g.73102 Transcript_31346/m.73102 type:complete len:449 (+) Transcript_31346:75-1421(+)
MAMDRRKMEDFAARRNAPSAPSSTRASSPPRKTGASSDTAGLLALISAQDLQISEQGTVIDDLQDRVKRLEEALAEILQKSAHTSERTSPRVEVVGQRESAPPPALADASSAWTSAPLPAIAAPPCSRPAMTAATPQVSVMSLPTFGTSNAAVPALTALPQQHHVAPSALPDGRVLLPCAAGHPQPLVVRAKSAETLQRRPVMVASTAPTVTYISRSQSSEPQLQTQQLKAILPFPSSSASTVASTAEGKVSTAMSLTPSSPFTGFAPGAGYLDRMGIPPAAERHTVSPARPKSSSIAAELMSRPSRVDAATSPVNFSRDHRRPLSTPRTSPSRTGRSLDEPGSVRKSPRGADLTSTPRGTSSKDRAVPSAASKSPRRALSPSLRPSPGPSSRRMADSAHDAPRRHASPPHTVLKLEDKREGFLKRGGGRTSTATRSSAQKSAWHNRE